MRINNLHIQNFKGIKEREVSFNPQFTVLIGDNGTGKTSILDVVAIGMGLVVQKIIPRSYKSPRPLHDNEIRKLKISPNNIEYADLFITGEFQVEQEKHIWGIKKSMTNLEVNKEHPKVAWAIGTSIAKNLKEDIDIPLMAYYSTARTSRVTHDQVQYGKIGSRTDGYLGGVNALIGKDSFLSWFKSFEDRALKFDEDKTLYYAFTQAISSMVPEWTDIKFHWALDDMLGKLEDGTWLPLSNLSDGYRGIVRLAADIAYRAIKLNPHLGADAVKETAGIVLIDELDLHLHPKWQKNIVQDLKRTFPKLQFIATTHSPFIVQSLEADEIINLDGYKIDQHPNTMSLDQNAAFMGVAHETSTVLANKTSLALDYLKILEEKEDKKVERERLEALIENSNDPVFKAKMQLEKLSKFGIE